MNNKFIFSFLFLFLFTISFSTATTQITPMEDVCMTEGYQYLDYNLTEYFNFHIDDECYLRLRDPDEVGYLDLPAGYATLWTTCYEGSYYFNSGHDWARFESYEDGGCYLPSGTYDNVFWCCQEGNCGNKFFADEFTINVSNACPGGGGGGGGGNESNTSLTESLVLYYDFEEASGTIYDRTENSYDATNSGAAYQESGKDGYCLGYDASASDEVYRDDLDEVGIGQDYTVSVWFKLNSYAESMVLHYDTGGSSDRTSLMWNGFRLASRTYSGGEDVSVSNTSELNGPGSWNHVTFAHHSNGTGIMYLNGVKQTGSTAGYGHDSIEMSVGILDTWKTDGWIDELAIFNKTINLTEVLYLYDSGTGRFYDDFFVEGNETEQGTPPVLNASIPDITLNNSETNTTNLTEHFWNYSEIYLFVPDPINEYIYVLPTGYGTINADYYEVDNYGTNFTVTSYDRPTDFEMNISACNGLYYEYCVNDTVHVWVNATLSGVLLLQTFFTPVDIGTTLAEGDSETYSGNSYFQYHDSMVFVYNESNYSGILNSTFPFNYTDCSNCINGANYTVFVNCSLGNNDTDYNILGDLNITLDCNEFTSYYTLSPYNNFNQTVLFNATNTVNSTWGSFLLYAGNPALWPGELGEPIIPASSTFWGNFSEDFSEVYADESTLTDSVKRNIVLVTLGVIIVGIFILFFKFVGVGIAIFLASIFSLFALFFFANIEYITFTTAFVVTAFVFAFYLIKFFRGGNGGV